MVRRRRKRKSAGSKKGPPFERRVCRDLSGWISSGKRDDIFWRSAMSGGRATIGRASGQDRSAQAGDISAIDPAGAYFLSQFAVECKKYQDFRFATLLLKGEGKFYQHWKKHYEECVYHNKLPFLVAKQDNMPTVLVLNSTGLKVLGISEFTSNFLYRGRIRIHSEGTVYSIQELHFFDWESFLQEVAPPMGRGKPARKTRPRLGI